MAEFDVETAEKIYAIERLTWRHAGLKEVRVRADLDVTMARYYQLVNALIDTEIGLHVDAITTKRLRRIRDERQLSRGARRAS